METKKFKFDKKHYHELKHFIDGFEELEFDWNGNEAEPFELKVIHNSREFLELIRDYAEIIAVFPTAIKAVQFEYEYNGVYCEIEIFSDKFKIFTVVNKTDKERTEIFGSEKIQEASFAFLKYLKKD